MSATTGSFSIGDSTVQMPVKTGTIVPPVVDISKLYAQTGMFTCDPGFTSTASCESEITYIDGEDGVLLYRGDPIEQIAEHGDFLETCYLLFYGQLPSAAQKKAFEPQPEAEHLLLCGPCSPPPAQRLGCEIGYRGEIHRGEHVPILDPTLFDAVQAKLVRYRYYSLAGTPAEPKIKPARIDGERDLVSFRATPALNVTVSRLN